LAELKQAEFSTIPVSNVLAKSTPSSRRLAITFDDGFRNVFEFGLPTLAANGFSATQFLVVDRIGATNEWDMAAGEAPAELMNIIEIGDWLAAGQRIGSHTLTHPFLTRISLKQAKEEIVASKQKLEDIFGVPVEDFCYPYGDWNPGIRDLVAQAGYRTACTTDFGINDANSDPFALKRITARYPSRNWKAFKRWIRGVFKVG
jgi:peptidoglycan/xylan/chitin deacetylase (PgdA/CDA1 family)